MSKAEFFADLDAADHDHRDLWPPLVLVKRNWFDGESSVFVRARWRDPEATHRRIYTPYPGRQAKYAAEIDEALETMLAVYARWLTEYLNPPAFPTLFSHLGE